MHTIPPHSLILIENYDSYSWNIIEAFAHLGETLYVVRNDAMSVAEVQRLQPRGLVLSPGPCTPMEAGILLEVVTHFAGQVPMLGVCLGHQAMAVAFGGKLVHAPTTLHAMQLPILHDGKGIYMDIANPIQMMCYNSLVVDFESFPKELAIQATSEILGQKMIMGLRALNSSCVGVQFHPESVGSREGLRLFANWLQNNELNKQPLPNEFSKTWFAVN